MFSSQCKTQTADCRLQTRGKMQTECKMQTESKMQTGVKCRIKTVDFFKHLCSVFSKSLK